MIATLLLPMGLLWMAVGLATIVLFFYKRWRLAFLGLSLFIFITLIGNKGVGKILLRTLEEPYRFVNPLAVEEPFDAVFVLGGGIRFRSDRFSYLGFTGDRAMLGARLYHSGKTKILVGAGTSFGFNDDGEQESDVGKIWRTLGIPSKDIVLMSSPVNTTSEMKRFAELQKKYGWKHVGLVTSAWHLPRAMRLAERFHIDFVPLPADFRGYSANTVSKDVIPTGQGVFLNETAFWEYMGILVGR